MNKDVVTLTFDTNEFCLIKLDHYIELYKKALELDRIKGEKKGKKNDKD